MLKRVFWVVATNARYGYESVIPFRTEEAAEQFVADGGGMRCGYAYENPRRVSEDEAIQVGERAVGNWED